MAGKGFSNMKPKTANRDSLRLEELLEIYKFNDHPDEWVQLRFLEADILPVRRHWVKIFAGKEKKLVTIPRFCVSFNPENEEEPLDQHCPYCDLSTEGGQDATMRTEHFYLVNAIVRDLQEDEPARKAKITSQEKKSGHKDIKSKSWTPVRVIRLTNTMVSRMQELGETNIVKNKKTGKKKAFDISHPKYGVDVTVKYKPKASGSDKYSADKVDGRTPLTEEEQEYLVWQLTPELLDLAGRMGEKQAAEDFKRMEILGDETVSDGDDDEDDDDMDDDVDLGPSNKKSKKKRKKVDLDDDDDDDEPPRKKKKKAVKKKSKKADLDDDDDDEPPRKKKKKPAKKKVKKKADLDDDEDDDEPPRKKKKKPVKKKSSKKKKVAFDDDDDDWDE